MVTNFLHTLYLCSFPVIYSAIPCVFNFQDAAHSTKVYDVNATDPDSGSGGAVYYSIVVSRHILMKHSFQIVFVT